MNKILFFRRPNLLILFASLLFNGAFCAKLHSPRTNFSHISSSRSSINPSCNRYETSPLLTVTVPKKSTLEVYRSCSHPGYLPWSVECKRVSGSSKVKGGGFLSDTHTIPNKLEVGCLWRNSGKKNDKTITYRMIVLCVPGVDKSGTMNNFVVESAPQGWDSGGAPGVPFTKTCNDGPWGPFNFYYAMKSGLDICHKKSGHKKVKRKNQRLNNETEGLPNNMYCEYRNDAQNEQIIDFDYKLYCGFRSCVSLP